MVRTVIITNKEDIPKEYQVIGSYNGNY